MEGWNEKKIGETAHFSKGKITEQCEGVNPLWLPLLNAEAIISESKFYANPKGAVICDENDILMLWDGERSGLVTRGKSGVVGSTFSKITINSELDSLYCFYFLQNQFEWIQNRRTGTGVPHVSKDLATTLSISFPSSLTEQRKVANILNTIDNSIAQTEQNITKCINIKQGLVHDLLAYGIDPHGIIRNPSTHQFEEKNGMLIPSDWDVIKLEQCTKINGRIGWKGYTVNDLREFGALTLGATHIDKANKLNLTNPVYLSQEKYLESPEIMVKMGDVLLVQRGSSIGKIVCIDREIGEATINPSMILLNNFTICSKFVYYFLTSIEGQRQIEFSTSQTGVPMISQIQVKNFNIPVPAPIEQQKIVSILDQQESLIESEQTNLAKLQKLKQGLMQDLLSGKVRVEVNA